MIKYFLNVLYSTPFFFLTSCESVCYEEQILHCIIHTHAKGQLINHNLKLDGSGGSIPDQVKGFSLSYVTDKPMRIAEARQLFVEGAEELLKMINSNEQLRPYMSNYPFTIANLDYMIAFEKRNRYFDPPFVALVFTKNEKLYFDFYDNEKRKFTDERRYVEPYSESYRIVMGGQ